MQPDDPGIAAAGDDTVAAQRRLRELFEEGLEQPVETLAAWIDARTENPAERAALRRLFDADAGVGVLETPAGELVARIEADAGADAWWQRLVGQRVGDFRLVRPLGQGGMGAVFLGEREGADFKQQAAVKLLRRGLMSAAEEALFRRERRALARLTHPHITRLIDGGVTDSGQPYLVMELVDGVPITDYAQRERLSLRPRLALFAAVCRAVGAAHRQLVVHRDIKPSNILVGADGTPKLLDFGIAKLLDEDGEDATRSGMTVLTRAYAAPEQLTGDPVSTATDVYALGVLLHELMLGERPATPTQRPSAHLALTTPDTTALAAPPATLRAALRGDLDNILLMAMASEPARRYASASALADDIDRYLAAQPVSAHPPSAWYRTRKFVQRHRGGVALSVIVALALIASLGVAAWQAREARAEAREALRQAQRADEIRLFLESLFQPVAAGLTQDQVPTLKDLVDRGAARIAERYPDAPDVRADLLAMFARLREALGETSTNRTLAADAVQANLAAYGAADTRTLAVRELHANLLRSIGDYRGARVELDAMRVAMREHGITGAPYAKLLDSLVAVGRETGMPPAEYIALEREALAAREGDRATTPTDLAVSYNNLGGAYQFAGDHAQAEAWYGKALAAFQAAKGDSLDTASAQQNVGLIQAESGRWPEAARSFAQARAIVDRIPLTKHPALVNLTVRWCGVLVDMESLDEAERVCAEGEAMARELHGPAHRQYVGALNRRGKLRAAQGRLDEARADFDAARAIGNALPDAADREIVLATVDTAQSRLWWLTGDFVPLRDAMLRLLDSAHPRLGRNTGGGFLFASLGALACARAPAPACGTDRAKAAEAWLRDPKSQGALRVPAQIALAEAGARAAGEAIAAIENELARFDASYGPGHSIRQQATRVIATLRTLVPPSPRQP